MTDERDPTEQRGLLATALCPTCRGMVGPEGEPFDMVVRKRWAAAVGWDDETPALARLEQETRDTASARTTLRAIVATLRQALDRRLGMIVALRAELQDARRGCRRLREERDAARVEAGTAAELRVALAEARAARGIAGRLQEHVQREPERVLRWWGSIPEARAAVLGAHVRGDLSEGQACRMLGVDRLTLREAADAHGPGAPEGWSIEAGPGPDACTVKAPNGSVWVLGQARG